MSILNVDNRQIKAYAKTKLLKRKSQVSGIIRTVLNAQALATRKKAIDKTIKQEMNTRSKFVTSSVLADFARGSNTRTMFSEIGAKKKWGRNKGKNFLGMAEQERGARISKPNIDTMFSRGDNIQKQVKPSLRFNRLGDIQEIDPTSQGVMVAALRALEAKNYKGAIRFTKSGRKIRKGVYKFGVKSFKQGGKSHKRLRMIKDESQQSVKLRKRPWLTRARVKAVTRQTTKQMYSDAYKKFTRERLR